MTSIDISSRRDLLDVALRSDLYAFTRKVFPIVSGGDAFLPNWHIQAITCALTEIIRGENNRLIINVPPRSLKSICASVALPTFVLGDDPTRRIICVSYSTGPSRHASQ